MMHDGSVKGEIGIEDLLVWAFQTEKASIHDDNGLDATTLYPEDSIVRSERVSVMGGFIQGTSPGARVLASNTADDAEIVAEAVARLRPLSRAQLVATHAKAGNRPDWKPHACHRWEPVRWIQEEAGEPYASSETVPPWEDVDHLGRERKRQPRKVWCPERRKTVHVPAPRWCRVHEFDAPAVVAAYRRRYVEWAYAVADVRLALLGRLERWSLTRDVPWPEPWKKI